MKILGGRKFWILSLLSLVLVGASIAEPRRGQGNPPRSTMEAQGMLNYLDLAGQTITIDGKLYPMSPDVVWYGLPAQPELELQLLRLSFKPIGYSLRYEQQTPVVHSVWVLPEGRPSRGTRYE